MPRVTERRTPTQDQLRAAYGKQIRDVIAADLRILFVGINPGLYSGAVGHHFARPGNRFWPALQGAGFTDRLLSPFEERLLLERGCGITNIVDRATARADELTETDLSHGIRASRKRSGAFDHAGSRSWESRPIKRSLIGNRLRSVGKQRSSEAPVSGSCRIQADSMRTTSFRLWSGCSATLRLPHGRRAEVKRAGEAGFSVADEHDRPRHASRARSSAATSS